MKKSLMCSLAASAILIASTNLSLHAEDQTVFCILTATATNDLKGDALNVGSCSGITGESDPAFPAGTFTYLIDGISNAGIGQGYNGNFICTSGIGALAREDANGGAVSWAVSGTAALNNPTATVSWKGEQ